MGLSASQGRLLSITSRLTSNEYESQQISNAKMRLAVQSQEASEEYISALNKQVFSLVSFDKSGNSISTPLTVASLYEYNDTKNQYLLVNASGKPLITHTDAQNYESSQDMQAFLQKYGLKKIYKTGLLEQKHADVLLTTGFDAAGINYNVFNDAKAKYDAVFRLEMADSKNSKDTWASQKDAALEEYLNADSLYKLYYDKQQQGEEVTDIEVQGYMDAMEAARATFQSLISYNSFIENIIREKAEKLDSNGDPSEKIQLDLDKDGNTEEYKYADIYKDYLEYKSALAVYQDELDSEGVTPVCAYQWDDETKAQWYTNLWYKINGSSTGNMRTHNYQEIDSKDLNTSGWVSDMIVKGTVNIESVSYTGAEMTLKYDNDPFLFDLNGIQWDTKIYSSCPDIVAGDNEKVVAQAEAEYQRKTVEINAKDEKYQRKLSLLDSEHHAMQTEYDSVKSAMDKNISRSFKTFQG